MDIIKIMKFLKLVLVIALLQFVQVKGWFFWWKRTHTETAKALPPLPAMVADLSDQVRRA